MKVRSVRQGFATNSSSDHSIIVFRDKSDKALLDVDLEISGKGYDMQWNSFIARSDEAKRWWFARQLKSVLSGTNLPPESVNNIIQELLGTHCLPLLEFLDTPFDYKAEEDFGSINHQSCLGSLPSGWTNEFLKTFRDFMLRTDVAIAGGNDNADDGFCPAGSNLFLPVSLWGDWSCHANGNFYTLFSKQTGLKIRLSGVQDYLLKADFPDLVDIKVTDKCNKGCPWCYQNSTPQGKHGKLEHVEKILEALKALGTLEVVFGGGEPTDYKKLKEVIICAKVLNLSVGFTTQAPSNLALKDVEADAIAVSFDRLTKAEQLTVFNLRDVLKEKLRIQFIPELYSPEQLHDNIAAMHKQFNHVTLLGWKGTGRAVDYTLSNTLTPIPAVAAFIKQLLGESLRGVSTYSHIGIDAALLAKIKPDLIEMGVCIAHLQEEEGRFSCYIDAVEGKIAKTSYGGPSVKLDFKGDLKDQIQTAFKGFQK